MSDRFGQSPAVTSLKEEQARQLDDNGKLTSGLEDTFPASDPLSMTSTSTATSVGTSTEGRVENDAPKVDVALAEVRARTTDERKELALTEIRALKEELAALSKQARSIPMTRSRFNPVLKLNPVSKFRLPPDVERQIQRNPIAAVGAAMLFGYVFGIAR